MRSRNGFVRGVGVFLAVLTLPGMADAQEIAHHPAMQRGCELVH